MVSIIQVTECKSHTAGILAVHSARSSQGVASDRRKMCCWANIEMVYKCFFPDPPFVWQCKHTSTVILLPPRYQFLKPWKGLFTIPDLDLMFSIVFDLANKSVLCYFFSCKRIRIFEKRFKWIYQCLIPPQVDPQFTQTAIFIIMHLHFPFSLGFCNTNFKLYISYQHVKPCVQFILKMENM